MFATGIQYLVATGMQSSIDCMPASFSRTIHRSRVHYTATQKALIVYPSSASPITDRAACVFPELMIRAEVLT